MYRHSSESFEEHVAATLEAQDRMLERLEEKLEKPVLNGGFDKLVAKVEKIETVTESLRDAQVEAKKKIDAIHVAVYDPDTGLYTKVKDNSKWITTVKSAGKWFIGLLIAGALTGAGKLLYDFAQGHIHFTP